MTDVFQDLLLDGQTAVFNRSREADNYGELTINHLQLKDKNLAKFDLRNVTFILVKFENCQFSTLTNITFLNCELTNIQIGRKEKNSPQKGVTNPLSATFSGCKKLSKIEFHTAEISYLAVVDCKILAIVISKCLFTGQLILRDNLGVNNIRFESFSLIETETFSEDISNNQSSLSSILNWKNIGLWTKIPLVKISYFVLFLALVVFPIYRTGLKSLKRDSDIDVSHLSSLQKSIINIQDAILSYQFSNAVKLLVFSTLLLFFTTLMHSWFMPKSKFRYLGQKHDILGEVETLSYKHTRVVLCWILHIAYIVSSLCLLLLYVRKVAPGFFNF